MRTLTIKLCFSAHNLPLLTVVNKLIAITYMFIFQYTINLINIGNNKDTLI